MSISIKQLREALIEAEMPAEKLREALLKFQKRGEMAKLAKASGITPATLTRIRKGKHQCVKYDTWMRLSKAEPEKIPDPLSDFINAKWLTQDESILLDNYRKVSEERKKSILNLSNVMLLDQFDDLMSNK